MTFTTQPVISGVAESPTAHAVGGPRLYTSDDIINGRYDMREVFGHTVPNPLPWRTVGFNETEDGVFESACYCDETAAEATRQYSYNLFALFHFNGYDWIKQQSQGRL